MAHFYRQPGQMLSEILKGNSDWKPLPCVRQNGVSRQPPSTAISGFRPGQSLGIDAPRGCELRRLRTARWHWRGFCERWRSCDGSV